MKLDSIYLDRQSQQRKQHPTHSNDATPVLGRGNSCTARFLPCAGCSRLDYTGISAAGAAVCKGGPQPNNSGSAQPQREPFLKNCTAACTCKTLQAPLDSTGWQMPERRQSPARRGAAAAGSHRQHANWILAATLTPLQPFPAAAAAAAAAAAPALRTPE